MTKILYFEGAGMDFYSEEQMNFSDVGNFRIRTSFLNNEGKQIYLEMMNGYIYDKKGKNVERFSLIIDFCFEVPQDKEEGIDYNKIFNKRKDYLKIREYDYTKKDITKWINENLNCNFDTIQVLNSFYGYYVHDGKGGFNLMEDIDLNHKRAAKRQEIYNLIDKEYREHTGSKYSVISLDSMDENHITIRSYASDEKLKGWPRIQKLAVVY